MSHRLYTEFIEASSIHGLKYANIYKSKCARIFWIILVLALLGLSYFLAGAIWLRFVGNPIKFSITSQHTPVEDIPFPAITICSENRMKRSNVDAFMKSIIYLPENVTKKDVRASLPLLSAVNGIVGRGDIRNMVQLRILDKVLKMNRYEPEEVIDILGQPCHDFIDKCQWEGNLVDCKTIFRPAYSVSGKCCSFNYAGHSHHQNVKPIRSKYFGASLGLTVALNTMDWDVEPNTRRPTNLMSLHGNNEFPLMTLNYVIVRGGFETFVSIYCSYIHVSADVEKLNLKSRKCALPGDIKLRNFWVYGETNCQIDCLTALLRERCNCTVYMLPRRPHDRVCGIPEVPCTLKELADILQYTQDCECPSTCSINFCQVDSNAIELSPKTTSPNPFYSQFNMNSSYAVVHFYYPRQVIRVQRQDLIASWIYVLYNLGGVFSLCVGCSLISVFEVFYYIFRYIKQKICSVRNRNRRQIAFCD